MAVKGVKQIHSNLDPRTFRDRGFLHYRDIFHPNTAVASGGLVTRVPGGEGRRIGKRPFPCLQLAVAKEELFESSWQNCEIPELVIRCTGTEEQRQAS